MKTDPKSLVMLTLITFATVILGGCDTGPQSPTGFSFPPGDAEAGKAVFLASQCLACHSLDGIDDSSISKEFDPPIKLGGKINYTMTYAELLTSVINPSHKLAKGYNPAKLNEKGTSLMRNYNDTMTISQLINLVTFLETQYELKPYHRSEYRMYYP